MTAVLGLNAYHGDAAAALVVDGELVAAAEEERFTRVKHAAGFPAEASRWCLEEAGVDPGGLEHVAIARDPAANTGPELVRTTVRHGTSARYLKECLENAARPRDVGAALAEALAVDRAALRARIHEIEHHLAHAASAYLASPFDDAAVLTVDGFGDFCSTMTATGRDGSLEVLERVLFPHSLGIFYTAVTQWLGFADYGDEGKVMGLAAHGDPERHARAMAELVQPHGDLFLLDLDYFTHDKEGVDMIWDEGAPAMGPIFSERLVEVLGEPRPPGAEIVQHHSDVAAALQHRLEQIYLHLADRLHARSGRSRLCLAGGVALNAVANGRVLRESAFEDVFVQPGASDAGTALGASLHVSVHTLGQTRPPSLGNACTGPGYSDAEIERALAKARLAAERPADAQLFALVAERIAAGDVVGWFQGRMEFGPRALGHRSILADPRRPEMRRVLNERVKQREPFRPFAISILREAAGEWLEDARPSPFMTFVHPLRGMRRDAVPAAMHVDGTCRVQTVERESEPRYHRLIEEFARHTGVPILLNTSFNENEPIVRTPDDALDTFRRTRIDLLVLGNHVLRRDGSGAD